MGSAIAQTRLEGRGVILECSLVPWDSEIFGFPVAQIGRVELSEGARFDDVLAEFDAWCTEHGVRFASCRLEHERLRESMALEGLGFRFVEMVYSPRFESFERIAVPRQELLVSEAESGDLDRIEEIAYSAFTTGRYLLDWRLPPELSRRRYAFWVRSSFDNPQQMILKGEIEGDLVGFFIVEHLQDQGFYWHLTAIAPKWQGQGMGMSLWQTMLIRHRTKGAAFVETTISAHNASAMNLYARLGFSFQSAKMTFHWLREQQV